MLNQEAATPCPDLDSASAQPHPTTSTSKNAPTLKEVSKAIDKPPKGWAVGPDTPY